MKQLCDTARKLSGKYGRPKRPLKVKYGKTITGKEGQLNKWAENFEELLNRPNPPNPQLTRTFQLTAKNRVGMNSGKLLQS